MMEASYFYSNNLFSRSNTFNSFRQSFTWTVNYCTVNNFFNVIQMCIWYFQKKRIGITPFFVVKKKTKHLFRNILRHFLKCTYMITNNIICPTTKGVRYIISFNKSSTFFLHSITMNSSCCMDLLILYSIYYSLYLSWRTVPPNTPVMDFSEHENASA